MEHQNNRPLDDLVLRKILGMIDCGTTLRSCRAVDIEWFNIFNEKAFANSVFMDVRNITREFPEGLGYDRNTHSFNERVCLSEIININVSTSKEMLQNEDIVDFFENKGHHLKYLALTDNENDSLKSATRFQFMELVLFKWCHQLETLRLVGMSQHRPDTSHTTMEKAEIPLKNLILDYAKYDYFLPSQRLMSLEEIFEHAKSLNSLTYIGRVDNLQIHCIPESFIMLSSNHCDKLTKLELKSVTIKRRSFDAIVNAGWPLQKFVFDGYFGDDMTARNLNSFIRSYTSTLKHVDLRVLWMGWYTEREVEIVVHELQQMQILKLNVDRLNVGYSGHFGQLQNLRHLELHVENQRFGTQYDLQTMFRNTSSNSLKSLWLDQWYTNTIGQVREFCPKIKALEVICEASRFEQFFSDLNISSHQYLEDLTIYANFKRSDVANGNWANKLVVGLSGQRLRVFKLSNNNMKHFDCQPFIRKRCIETWLSEGVNKYFQLEFVGFMIRADEMGFIARMLSMRANFTKWVDCIVVDMSNIYSPKRLPLGKVEFFQSNVEELIVATERKLALI